MVLRFAKVTPRAAPNPIWCLTNRPDAGRRAGARLVDARPPDGRRRTRRGWDHRSPQPSRRATVARADPTASRPTQTGPAQIGGAPRRCRTSASLDGIQGRALPSSPGSSPRLATVLRPRPRIRAMPWDCPVAPRGPRWRQHAVPQAVNIENFSTSDDKRFSLIVDRSDSLIGSPFASSGITAPPVRAPSGRHRLGRTAATPPPRPRAPPPSRACGR